jgi:hypothetical protein
LKTWERRKLAISVSTVLILGAGSSHHAGYPLGVGLLNQISQRLHERDVHPEIAATYPPDELEVFRQRFSRSGYRSIDTFLERNQDCSKLGKLLIANCLMDCENVDRLFPPHDPNWYGLLFDALRGDEPDSVFKAPLTIVTFNCDRSLEAYLHESILAHYHHLHLSRHDAAMIVKKMQILHPHGILGPYPEVPYQKELDGIKLQDITNDLTIIHEFNAAASIPFVAREFASAYRALNEASRIIFLGFGFHEDNVRRFQFFKPVNLAGKQLLATNMVRGKPFQAVLDRLKQFGFQPEHFWDGGCQSLLTERILLDQAAD